MNELDEIRNELREIQQRNRKVEADKAWEISWTRKLLLVMFTYITIGLYMQVIGVRDVWLNAIVPAVGFLLSTQSLPFFRALWERYLYRK